MDKRNTKPVTDKAESVRLSDIPAAHRQRLLTYFNPDLLDAQNQIMYSIARCQGHGGPLKLSQFGELARPVVKELIMDGWIIQSENDDLLITEQDLHEFGIWVPVEDCGCGNSKR
jgi:hypothetical protein